MGQILLTEKQIQVIIIIKKGVSLAGSSCEDTLSAYVGHK